jgi:hypothetical protein
MVQHTMKLTSLKNKGNNKITELRTILQRKSQNSLVYIWLWRLKCHFQQYFSYNMAVSCIGGGNWSPRENHIGLSQVTDKLDHIILYQIHFAVSLNRTHNSLIAQIVVNPTTIRS